MHDIKITIVLVTLKCKNIKVYAVCNDYLIFFGFFEICL